MVHIRHKNSGQRLGIKTVTEYRTPYNTAFSPVKSLKRRGCGRQDKQCFAPGYDISGDVPGVLFGRLLGFIGIFLLLIDYYYSEIFHRSKYSRAGADYHGLLSGSYKPGGVASFPV